MFMSIKENGKITSLLTFCGDRSPDLDNRAIRFAYLHNFVLDLRSPIGLDGFCACFWLSFLGDYRSFHLDSDGTSYPISVWPRVER
jgi:hypothetical protein